MRIDQVWTAFVGECAGMIVRPPRSKILPVVHEHDIAVDGVVTYPRKWKNYEPSNGGTPQRMNPALFVQGVANGIARAIKQPGVELSATGGYQGPIQFDILESWRPLWRLLPIDDWHRATSILIAPKTLGDTVAASMFNNGATMLLEKLLTTAKMMLEGADLGLYAGIYPSDADAIPELGPIWQRLGVVFPLTYMNDPEKYEAQQAALLRAWDKWFTRVSRVPREIPQVCLRYHPLYTPKALQILSDNDMKRVAAACHGYDTDELLLWDAPTTPEDARAMNVAILKFLDMLAGVK